MPSDSVQPSTKGLGRLLFRALVVIILIFAAAVAIRWTPLAEWFEQERLAAALDRLRHTPWAAPVLIGLFLLFSPLGVPVSPLILAGGAVFGMLWGWILNVIGALAGALLSFWIARWAGRDLVVHMVSERRLQQAEKILEHHGFWTIFRIRFLPIPFAFVNYGAALAGVRWPVFLVSTALGLAPSLAIYTYLSHALVTAAAEDRLGVALIGAAVLVAVLLITFIPAMMRRARNRQGTMP